MQFMGFSPNFARFSFQLRFRNRNHSKKKLRLTRFFSTGPDTMFEIGFGHSIIRFAIVCTDACSGSHQLIHQSIIDRAPRYLFREYDNRLSKTRCSFFQIVDQRLSDFP